MKKKQFLPANEIHYGDIIALDSQHKLGLVHTVLKSPDNNSVISFKVMPIHVHDMTYRRENDSDNFMMPNSMKLEMGLQNTNQYRLILTLEDYKPHSDENPDGIVFRLARANASPYSGRAIRKMDDKIREGRRISEQTANDVRTFIFHKDIPTHVKERAKPSDVLVPNISLADAHQHEIISETLYQTLSRGTYGRSRHITMLREAFELANAKDKKSLQRIAEIIETGISRTNVTLRQAFEDGALNETASFNKFRDANINGLFQAMKICKEGKAPNTVDPYDADHIRQQPMMSMAAEISSSWRLFATAAAKHPETFQEAGVKYMYPA